MNLYVQWFVKTYATKDGGTVKFVLKLVDFVNEIFDAVSNFKAFMTLVFNFANHVNSNSLSVFITVTVTMLFLRLLENVRIPGDGGLPTNVDVSIDIKSKALYTLTVKMNLYVQWFVKTYATKDGGTVKFVLKLVDFVNEIFDAVSNFKAFMTLVFNFANHVNSNSLSVFITVTVTMLFLRLLENVRIPGDGGLPTNVDVSIDI